MRCWAYFGREVDVRIHVKEVFLTGTWLLQATVLGVEKFSLVITELRLFAPITVLGIKVIRHIPGGLLIRIPKRC